MNTRFLKGASILLAFSSNVLFAAPLFLVKDGQPAATIVIPDDPSLTESFAAEELATYLKKSTGAVLPVVKEKEAFAKQPEGTVVLVGGTEKTKTLGVTLKGVAKGGFLIKRTGNFLVFRGEDDRVKSVDPRQCPETYYGTLVAVYDFIEKNIGVRWYWPGPLGEIVPEHRNVSIEVLDYRENPDFEYRYSYGRYSTYDDPDFKHGENLLWWARQRLGSAGAAPATHSFAGYVAKYGTTHPEYFVLRKDGKRLTDTDHGGGHICLSNKEFQKILIADIIKGFKANPDWYTCAVMPGDSFEGCECEQCKAQYEPALGPTGIHSRSVWSYVNEVAREVGKVFPDRYIGCCAYASYYMVPTGMKFEPNVAVTVCRGGADIYFWDQKDIEQSHNDIRAWAKNSKKLFTWEYPCSAQVYGLPIVFPHGVNEEVRRMKSDGIIGTITEPAGSGEPAKYGGDYTGWMRENLTTYLFFKSLWKADIDVDVIVDGYCRDLYGPAAEPMKKFFVKMEQIWKKGNHGTRPYYANWSNIWTCLYTEEDIDLLLGLLKKAEKLVPEGVYKQRVQKTIAGFSVLSQNR